LRLLLVNHEFTITGASTVFFRLALQLQAQGHEVAIFPCNPADGPMQARYAAAAIPVLAAAVPGEYDLALCNGIGTASLVQRIAPFAPVIWLVHEAEVAVHLLLRHQEMIPAFTAASAIVYETPYQAEVLRSFTFHLPASKFHVIPNGVAVDPARLARARIPPKTHRLRAVQVGTMEPRKRPGDFIRAVAMSGLDMEAVICGKFFQMDEAALAIVREKPETYLLLENLPDEEVLAWVESADIFCLASGSETQGLAAYEAALLSRPLLLSDLPCYRDIFIHGRNCLTFPPGHVEMLALSLCMYAASPALRAEMGAAARRTASRFTLAGFFARFDALLQDIAAQPRG
jgi:glycosyltransferase involved in cell wall biosynthesis